MGNEQSKKTQPANIEIQLNHTRINFIKVINEKGKRYMQALFGVQSSDYEAWTENVKKAKLSSNYLLLPFHHEFQSKAMCGTTGSAKVNYENYPYLLIQQIQNRRAKKKRFDQTELWLLMYCLLDAQKQMRNGAASQLGDVRPQNIFFNQQGSIKVANLLSWPKEVNNYQKFLQNQSTYLAPEDMKLVQTSQLSNNDNKLSEIFSIGLTVLSSANLVDYKYLYNTKTSSFNFQEFIKILNEWRVNEYYSDIFKATLCSLLEMNLDQRISELELQPWLQNYRKEILERNDFVITDPPKKIIHQVQLIRNLYENAGQASYTHTQGFSNFHGSDQKRIISGLPLQGSRRLVQERRLPPISSIPGTSATESIYTPSVQKSTYLSNYLLQGAPITTTNPVYINRTSVPGIQSHNLVESTYTRNWSSQGGNNVPKTHFEYNSSPDRQVYQVERNLQKSPEKVQKQQENQPEIVEQKRQNDIKNQ